MIERALLAAGTEGLVVERDPAAEASDADRLTQVFINLISNARKYCDAPRPRLKIVTRQRGAAFRVSFPRQFARAA